jgi:hypothetical protein
MLISIHRGILPGHKIYHSLIIISSYLQFFCYMSKSEKGGESDAQHDEFMSSLADYMSKIENSSLNCSTRTKRLSYSVSNSCISKSI